MLTVVERDGPRFAARLALRMEERVRVVYEELAGLVGTTYSDLMRQALEAQVPAMRELVRRLKLDPERYERLSDRLYVQAALFRVIEAEGERLVRILALTPEELEAEWQEMQARAELEEQEDEERYEAWLADQQPPEV